MLSFGIEFVPMVPISDIVRYVTLAEEKGFEYVWITDHFNNRNVYVTLTTLALKTRKIKIGTGVTNPYLINPVVTAQAIATLSEVAPGRIILGLGPGDRVTFNTLGVKAEKPLAAVKETVEIARRLFAGGTVENFQGKVFFVRKAKLNFAPKGRIPIYIGAQGPKMLGLAAEMGDGVLINASHPKDFIEARRHIEEGLQRARRKKEELDVAAYTSFSISESREAAEKAVTPVTAFIVAGSPDAVLKRHGIDIEKARTIGEAISKGDFKRAFSLVTPEMREAFSVCGTPRDCVQRIHELVDEGVTQVVVGSPIGPKVEEAIELISSKVMPEFR